MGQRRPLHASPDRPTVTKRPGADDGSTGCGRCTRARPPKGLYDPRFEHDACGVAFVATLTGEASHDIVAKALTALRNLDHRGAAGAEANSGDGAGILLQVPDAFLREVVDFDAPAARVRTPWARRSSRATPTRWPRRRQRIEELADEEGLTRARLARRPGRPQPRSGRRRAA